MSAANPCLDDYKASITYEDGVYLELRRRKRVNALQNVDHLEWIFRKRIMTTYRRGLNRFPTDFDLNAGFFDFLTRFSESYVDIIKHHANNMIWLLEHNPDVFIKTSAWYLHYGKNGDARRILQRGQQVHPQSLEIYLDLIKIEIRNPFHRRNQNRLKTYIDEIVNAGITHRFLEEIIKIFSGREALKEVLNHAIHSLLVAYRAEPAVWSFIASRELQGDYYPSGSENTRNLLYSIERARQRYKDGIAVVPIDKQPFLWKKYLEMVMNLHKEHKTTQILNILREVLEEATIAKMELQESHYLAWFDCCLNNTTLLVKKMEEGTKAHPRSLILWSIYLKYYICLDEFEFAKQVFEKAVDALGPKSAKVWQAYIDFLMLRSPARDIDDVYEKAISLPHEEIVKMFKPRYLDWILSSRGIRRGRTLYLRIATQPPYTKKLHWCMFTAEKMSDLRVLTTPFQEQLFDTWMEQFGHEDVDVHFQKIKHVKELGGRNVNEKLSEVYEEAIRRLSDDEKVSQFKTMFENLR